MILEAVTPVEDKAQRDELRAFGDARAKKFGASAGFELARQSCRLSLRMLPAFAQTGLDPEELF